MGRRAARTEVQVRLDPAAPQGPTWVICTEDGTELRRHPAQELSRERILALEVTHRKPSALRRRRRSLHPDAAELAVRPTGG